MENYNYENFRSSEDNHLDVLEFDCDGYKTKLVDAAVDDASKGADMPVLDSPVQLDDGQSYGRFAAAYIADVEAMSDYDEDFHCMDRPYDEEVHDCGWLIPDNSAIVEAALADAESVQSNEAVQSQHEEPVYIHPDCYFMNVETPLNMNGVCQGYEQPQMPATVQVVPDDRTFLSGVDTFPPDINNKYLTAPQQVIAVKSAEGLPIVIEASDVKFDSLPSECILPDIPSIVPLMPLNCKDLRDLPGAYPGQMPFVSVEPTSQSLVNQLKLPTNAMITLTANVPADELMNADTKEPIEIGEKGSKRCVPSSNVISASEVVVMRPLRTRKPATRPRVTVTSPEVATTTTATTTTTNFVPYTTVNSPIIAPVVPVKKTSPVRKVQRKRERSTITTGTNLCAEIDERVITIPLLSDISRPKISSGNRRKQELIIIPGSDNLEFQIQNDEKTASIGGGDIGEKKIAAAASMKTLKMVVPSQPDLYPENGLPELEEIFKRKKKPPTMKRPSAAAHPRKYSSKTTPQNFVRQSSISFEEKVSMSMAMRQERLHNMLTEKTGSSSDTEFEESDSNLSETPKSQKCSKCLKLFKTTRTLLMHMKRCTVVMKEPPLAGNIVKLDLHSVAIGMEKKILLKEENNSMVSKLFAGNTSNCKDDCKIDLKKMNTTSKRGNVNSRPITRSQTKRTSGSICKGAAKRKCC